MTDPTERPIVAYPCGWNYTVIGWSEDEVRAAVALVVGDLDHELKASHTSAAGKYVSFRLRVLVRDEAERNLIHAELTGHPRVRMVL